MTLLRGVTCFEGSVKDASQSSEAVEDVEADESEANDESEEVLSK